MPSKEKSIVGCLSINQSYNILTSVWFCYMWCANFFDTWFTNKKTVSAERCRMSALSAIDSKCVCNTTVAGSCSTHSIFLQVRITLWASILLFFGLTKKKDDKIRFEFIAIHARLSLWECVFTNPVKMTAKVSPFKFIILIQFTIPTPSVIYANRFNLFCPSSFPYSDHAVFILKEL